ncbi:MAG: hypothetical protein KA712_10510 [Myxococcales bacterium]|nr:hypothetical protein [Myxococcales bacterium]
MASSIAKGLQRLVIAIAGVAFAIGLWSMLGSPRDMEKVAEVPVDTSPRGVAVALNEPYSSGKSRGGEAELRQVMLALASAVIERENVRDTASKDGDHKTPHTESLDKLLSEAPRSEVREQDVDSRLRKHLEDIAGADVLSVKCVEAFCKVEFVVPSGEEAVRGSVSALQAVSRVESSLMLDFVQVGSRQLGVCYFPPPGEALPFPG